MDVNEELKLLLKCKKKSGGVRSGRGWWGSRGGGRSRGRGLVGSNLGVEVMWGIIGV